MSKFMSDKIHIINTWTISKNDNLKCPNGINLMFNNFIYELEKTIDGKKKLYRFNIDRYTCGTNILKENYKLEK